MQPGDEEINDLANRLYGAWGIIEVCRAQLSALEDDLLTVAPAAGPKERVNLHKAAEKDFWAVSAALQSAQILIEPLKPFLEGFLRPEGVKGETKAPY